MSESKTHRAHEAKAAAELEHPGLGARIQTDNTALTFLHDIDAGATGS